MKPLFLALCLLAASASASASDVLKRELLLRGDALGCPPTLVWPPVTVYSAITPSSCLNRIDLRSEVFSVHVRRGEILTIDLASPDFEVYLFMSLGGGRSGPDRRASWLWSGVSRMTMSYVAEETRTYEIEAMHLNFLDEGLPITGPYTMKIEIAGTSVCTPPTPFGESLATTTVKPGTRVELAPRFYATDPVKIEWLDGSTVAFTGWPFLTPPVMIPTTWSYRLSNACGSRVESIHLVTPARRRAIAH